MKKKLLYILNIAKRVNNFSYTSMTVAKKLGIEFHIAGNWSYASDEERIADEEKYGIKIHQIDFVRTPYHPGNLNAYRQLKHLVQTEGYDCIHCNTPIGGILGRLVGKKYNIRKVIYQAHGFHFYKGAPKKNRIIYYPVEKRLAHYTDALITINSEDFKRAKSKFKLRKNGKVYYVPGVGIDTTQYNSSSKMRENKRLELGLGENDISLISMGDLIDRKNYATAIRSIAETNDPKLQYFICGKGPEEENLRALAESLGVAKQIHFLGFRSDIKELLVAADIFLFTTKQEGLPRSMMEAMASGLPCIASKIRGNTDLLDGTEGGFLCETTDTAAYAEKLKLLANDKALRKAMGKNNLIAIQKFNTETVNEELCKVYEAEFSGGVTFKEYTKSLLEYLPLWAKKRVELSIPLDAFLLISVGELNTNKNNSVIISAMEKLKGRNIHYVICGAGDKEADLREQVNKVGLCENVHFLGYRTDVRELYEAAGCFVMPSFREGLSRSVMEAMASGLPCVVSEIRGNNDLITDNKGGFLCEPSDSERFAEAIGLLCDNKPLCDKMSLFNKTKIKDFDTSVSEKAMESIYAEVLGE